MNGEGRVQAPCEGCGHADHGTGPCDHRMPSWGMDQCVCPGPTSGRVFSPCECREGCDHDAAPGRGLCNDADLRQRLADALFAYNTPQAHHFVIHDGGYEGIADAVLAVLRESGTVEYRVVCADGSVFASPKYRPALIALADEWECACGGPHRIEYRAVVTLPWTAVET